MDSLRDQRGDTLLGDGPGAHLRGATQDFDNTIDRSSAPLSKTRSLSDGGGPQLSPSPFIVEASRRTSKDDTSLDDRASDWDSRDMVAPVTPRRPGFHARGGLNLAIEMLPQDSQGHAPLSSATSYIKPVLTPTPLSPKLDHSQIYASPTNILPRRSRGLDFSRAATSLHHSTLAEQASPDSSPTIGGRAMNIPGRGGSGRANHGRGSNDHGADQSGNSLWSIMGTQERMQISSSVGSTSMFASGSSSSSDEDDFMDDDMEDAIMSTPQQLSKNSSNIGMQTPTQVNNVVPWMPETSPAVSSLSSFRTRPRRQPKKKLRGLLGVGFNAALSRSPPSSLAKETRDMPISHSRRESISWAANQLHISSSDNDDRNMDNIDGLVTPSKDGQRGVVKRAVTRRGNLLPKTKNFARIRAALAEESTPVDAELHREAEVIRQVRESDVNLEPRIHTGPPPPLDLANLPPTVQSSPDLNPSMESNEDVPEMDMEADSGLSNTLKYQAIRNSRGRNLWEALSETSSLAGNRVTPPPPAFLPRGSSSGISEDINMDSPSLSAGSGNTTMYGPVTGPGLGGNGSDSQRSELQQPSSLNGIPPTAAEITRRINNKRRRDDDFDSMSFKRRAVSPGMSAHNSPIMQSPLQRDVGSWSSRPGSNQGVEKASGPPSENGSTGANNGVGAGSSRPISSAKGRIGLQGMTDTNDGLMRMSIE